MFALLKSSTKDPVTLMRTSIAELEAGSITPELHEERCKESVEHWIHSIDSGRVHMSQKEASQCQNCVINFAVQLFDVRHIILCRMLFNDTAQENQFISAVLWFQLASKLLEPADTESHAKICR